MTLKHLSGILTLTLILPVLAHGQLSSENYVVEGGAVPTYGSSLSGTSTSYQTKLEAGGLYQISTTSPIVSPPTSGDGTRTNQNNGTLGKSDSITICHAAGNEKYVTNSNVQVFITLAKSGATATLRGHDGHERDIVPAFQYDFGDGVKTYLGNNWSEANKILYANNCKLFLNQTTPVQLQPPVVPPGPVPPLQEPVTVCDTNSVYTKVTSALDEQSLVTVTVPTGALTSKEVESKGKSNYSLLFKVTPINSNKTETFTEKFTNILVKYQENTDNDNIPFGIQKKLQAQPYVPPQPVSKVPTNTTVSTSVVRVESKPPCEVTTVILEEATQIVPQPVVVNPAITPVNSSEQVVVVSDVLEIPDVLEWNLDEVDMPIPPFEVSVIDELGNAITEFTQPVVIEITHPSILGSQSSIHVMQPSADGSTWYEVPFEVNGDTIRITIDRPGEFFIWFFPKTVEAAVETPIATTGIVPRFTIEFPRWLLDVASTVGLGTGVLALLLQLSRMPIALEHLSRNLSTGLNNLIGLLTFRKRRRPWGTVYDSMTKAPVDPAYVELFDELGNKKAEAFTDLDGRYGFLVPQGSYSMMVRKTNYTFPSKMANVTGQDVIYHNLYFGGTFNASDTVVHDVPMDPQSFDWNQHEKLRTKQTRFFHRLDPLFVSLLDIIFYLGFLTMCWQFITSVSVTTGALFALYSTLLIMRFVTGKPRLYGTISKSGQPLAFSILRVRQNGTEILTKIVDEYGRYIALVPNGDYTLVIEEHITHDRYRTVYEKKIRAKHGVINSNIKVM